MANTLNKLRTVQNYYDYVMSRYNIVWSFSGIFFALLNCFKRVPRNIDFLFLCHDVHRNSRKDGKLYAPLIDPIVEELSKTNKCLTLAMPFSRQYGVTCFGEVEMHNFVVVIALFKRHLFAILGTEKSIENDPLVLAYKGLLKKICPKIIIGIQPSVEFCTAAKQLGIATCDMQHGLISDANYYSPAKRQRIKQQGWPDHILCWDRESATRANRMTEGNSVPYVIGNPSYHSLYGAELHLPDSTYSHKRKREFKSEVLVTATYHDYKAVIEDEVYRNVGIPTRIIDIIKQSPDVFWRIRLHPVMVQFHFDRINLLLQNEFKKYDNVNWFDYSNITIGQALSGCSGHLTVESASALDAEQNSIRTLLVGCDGISDEEKANLYFREYIEAGTMKYVEPSDFSLDSLNFFSVLGVNSFDDKNREDASKKFSEFIIKIKGHVTSGNERNLKL